MTRFRGKIWGRLGVFKTKAGVQKARKSLVNAGKKWDKVIIPTAVQKKKDGYHLLYR